jgi:hypothetical protein
MWDWKGGEQPAGTKKMNRRERHSLATARRSRPCQIQSKQQQQRSSGARMACLERLLAAEDSLQPVLNSGHRKCQQVLHRSQTYTIWRNYRLSLKAA